MATAVVNARVDRHAKEEAQRVLAEMGMSLSGAIQNLISYIAQTGAVPDLTANAEQIKRERLADFREAMEFFEKEDMLKGVGDDYRQVLNEGRDRRFG